MLVKREITREIVGGKGEGGLFILSDSRALFPRLLEEYAGKVQLIYLDPPFATGQQFSMRMRVGERDWKGSTGSLPLATYDDAMNRSDYLAMMREVLTAAWHLLSDTGVLFLHIDFRMHAPLRLLMDDIFGANNFVNEIVWAYQTGGRAKAHFSRKHDIILFFRKSRKYRFNIANVPIARTDARRNHMKRHVDADGRVYRSIRSGGKIYTYYDDEPAYPGDVWDDVSSMQQHDPQRTGYETQKPLRLLERIVLCSTEPGDLVVDLFAGSGTTLDAAATHGRRFLGVDIGRLSYHVIRKRLSGRAEVTYEAPACEGNPTVHAELFCGIAYYDIELTHYEMESGISARQFAGLDAVDGWAVGYLRGDAFVTMEQHMRTKQSPQLNTRLQLPVFEGTPMIRVSDVLGRYFYYSIEE